LCHSSKAWSWSMLRDPKATSKRLVTTSARMDR
jgi:hypothetical protein